MYNLLSDKLEKFEKEMRRIRNQIVAKVMYACMSTSVWIFSKCKPYIHTEFLRKFKEMVTNMSEDIEREIELRKKLSTANPREAAILVRDSSVLTSETLKNQKINLSKTMSSNSSVGTSRRPVTTMLNNKNESSKSFVAGLNESID